MKQLLGLDVGERRIGVAVSDPEGAVAVPVDVIQRMGGGADWDAVLQRARARDVDTVVVGMPLSMNGRLGPQARAVSAFVKALKSATGLEVVTWDERLTSVEADRRLREAAPERRRGPSFRPPKGSQDAVAAALILQAYLDARPASRP